MRILFSDKKIVEALKNGNDVEADRAFRQLYKTHYEMARQFVVNNSGNETDAEDVFQDVLVAFYRNIRKGSFRGDSSVKTYLYSMVRNQWLMRLKKNKRSMSTDEPENIGQSLHMTQQPVSGETLNEMVAGLLGQVSERCREILKLYYFDNLSMYDISKRAGFENEKSAKTQKYKCMKRLIEFLAEKTELKESLNELLAE